MRRALVALFAIAAVVTGSACLPPRGTPPTTSSTTTSTSTSTSTTLAPAPADLVAARAPSTETFLFANPPNTVPFQVRNAGGSTSVVPTIAFEAEAVAAGFSIVDNTCTAPLAPNATCTFSTAYSGTAAGFETGFLNVTGAPGDNDRLGVLGRQNRSTGTS